MNGLERRALKRAVDERVRELVANVRACAECGGELDERTFGCRACHSRHQNRRYRARRRERLAAA